jgi:hypothetical protein
VVFQFGHEAFHFSQETFGFNQVIDCLARGKDAWHVRQAWVNPERAAGKKRKNESVFRS